MKYKDRVFIYHSSPYLTVTLFAKLRGLSGSFTRLRARKYASSWAGTTSIMDEVIPASGTLIHSSKTDSLVGEIPIIIAPRDLSSIALDIIADLVSSFGTNTIQGIPSLIREISQCFGSPPANPSACI